MKLLSPGLACCEPINDFKKNSQELYPILEFKSGHPPANLAGICLFHEGWTERFLIHQLGISPSKVV
jgi:hypothetical protein